MMCICLAMMGGCSWSNLSASSMNLQRAGIRTAADMAVTVTLDAASDMEVEKRLIKTRAIAVSIETFLKTGDFNKTTMDEFVNLCRRVVPVDYQYIVDFLMRYTTDVSLPVDKLGEKNIRRLEEACAGMIVACDRYVLTDRPVKEGTDGGSNEEDVSEIP